MKTWKLIFLVNISSATVWGAGTGDVGSVGKQAAWFNTFQGVTVSGITDKGVESKDFKLLPKESKGVAVYEGTRFEKPVSEKLYFLKKDGKTQVIQQLAQKTSDGKSYITVTSAIFKNGKLASQLNCENLAYYSQASESGCQATTEKLCQEILNKSGKKSFQEIINTHSEVCEPLENAYYKALSNENVRDSVIQAYADSKMMQNAAFPEDTFVNDLKTRFKNVFGLDQFGQSVYIQKPKSTGKVIGLPMVEILKQCDHYKTMGVFNIIAPAGSVKAESSSKEKALR